MISSARPSVPASDFPVSAAAASVAVRARCYVVVLGGGPRRGGRGGRSSPGRLRAVRQRGSADAYRHDLRVPGARETTSPRWDDVGVLEGLAVREPRGLPGRCASASPRSTASRTWRRSGAPPIARRAARMTQAHVPLVALPPAGVLRQVEHPDLSALLTHFCSRGRPLGAGVPPDVHAMSASDRLRSILWEQRLRAFVTYSGGDPAVCITEATLAGLQFLIGKRGYQPWGLVSTPRASMTPVVDRFGMRGPSSTAPSARTILRFDPGPCAWTPARTGWRSGSGGSCGPATVVGQPTAVGLSELHRRLDRWRPGMDRGHVVRAGRGDDRTPRVGQLLPPLAGRGCPGGGETRPSDSFSCCRRSTDLARRCRPAGWAVRCVVIGLRCSGGRRGRRRRAGRGVRGLGRSGGWSGGRGGRRSLGPRGAGRRRRGRG